MQQISTRTVIHAPPEAVWEAITTPKTYESWMTIHTKWKSDVEGTRFERGASVDEVVTMLGMPNTISWTVDALEEPSHMRISGVGMAAVKVSFDFKLAPNGNGGTEAMIEARYEGQMITGALGKAVEQDGRRQLEESLAKLSTLLGE